MIGLIALLLTICGLGLFIQGSWWCLLYLLLGGVAWVFSDSLDDDLTVLGGVVLLIFFLAFSYIIIKTVAEWLTSLVMCIA